MKTENADKVNLIKFIEGSFHVKSPNPPHLKLPTRPMDFVEILSGEFIHQEIKILKILSLYQVWLRNYEHLKHGPFSLDTEPSKFLAFWNCFYSVILNRKHLKFGLAIYFHTIISKTVYLAKSVIKQVCGGVLKLLKLLHGILAYMVELGAAKVGPRLRNDILG